MKLAVCILLCAVSAGAQSLTPKETTESVKLQLAMEKEKTLQLQYQVVQAKIEPELAPLRQQYADQEKQVLTATEVVKKENGWGDDVVLDKNPQSATFGKFIHEAKKAEPKK